MKEYIYIHVAGFHTGIISEGEGITEDCVKGKYHRGCEGTNPLQPPTKMFKSRLSEVASGNSS